MADTISRGKEAIAIVARYLSPKSAAIYSGLSRTTIFRLIRSGQLPASKVGGRLLIAIDALDTMVAASPRAIAKTAISQENLGV